MRICHLDLSHQQRGEKHVTTQWLENTQKYSIKTGQLYLCRSMYTHAVMLHTLISVSLCENLLSFICCTLLSPHLRNVATLRHFYIWGVHKLVAWQPHVRATWLSIKTTSLLFLKPSTVTSIFTNDTLDHYCISDTEIKGHSNNIGHEKRPYDHLCYRYANRIMEKIRGF